MPSQLSHSSNWRMISWYAVIQSKVFLRHWNYDWKVKPMQSDCQRWLWRRCHKNQCPQKNNNSIGVRLSVKTFANVPGWIKCKSIDRIFLDDSDLTIFSILFIRQINGIQKYSIDGGKRTWSNAKIEPKYCRCHVPVYSDCSLNFKPEM